ncbi:MAG: SDR family NAD(P)-dependent oxidoreductase [Nocardioidaceae bacterium]|nr:MAG: SDR family NAD(P)-dependent oxidoreductase [Nocardioidaceae bacterium]
MTVRTALVTGAGRGIGAAIATALAEQGHRVALADIDLVSAERTAAAINAAAGSRQRSRFHST